MSTLVIFDSTSKTRATTASVAPAPCGARSAAFDTRGRTSVLPR
ncbi:MULTISPECIES: hypothetical protein [Cryobacterium]|nr:MULTISPECIES: hypothetical protein [Cryobacterium]